MDGSEPRSGRQRKSDALAKLQERHIDVWVASAPGASSDHAVAHLVPLSLAWLRERAVVAVERDSLTARNVIASGRARLAVGPTRDVVMIDVTLDEVVDVNGGASELADGYAGQADWDPREAGGSYVFLVLRPDRMQAWREANELSGRTLMRGGSWLV